MLDWKINTHQYTPDIILNSWKYFIRTALHVSQCEVLLLSFAYFAGFGFAVWQHTHTHTETRELFHCQEKPIIKVLHLPLFQSAALKIQSCSSCLPALQRWSHASSECFNPLYGCPSENTELFSLLPELWTMKVCPSKNALKHAVEVAVASSQRDSNTAEVLTSSLSCVSTEVHKIACTYFFLVPSIPMTFYLFICGGGEHTATCGHHGNNMICWLYSFPWCMLKTIGKRRDTWAKVSWLESLELVEITLKF